MTAAYEGLTDAELIPRAVQNLSAKTVVTDVEPLIAPWNSDQQALDRGIAQFLDRLAAIGSVQVVCFATNSARLPSALPDDSGIRVEYLASARKPLRTAPYRGMPVPGVVVGDQVVTDGVLAKRIGYTFLHYQPRLGSMPAGPRLLFECGVPLRAVLFGSRGER